MTPRRFLVPSLPEHGATVTLGGDLHRHAVKVLRLKCGSDIILADGAGRECSCRITDIGKGELTVRVEGVVAEPATEAGPRITLYQGLPKGEKLDLILQKCTELGVGEIVTFAAERSVARIAADQREERLARWQRIVREAARQSRRTVVPPVTLATDLTEVLGSARQAVRLLLWEEATGSGLKEALAGLPVPADVGVLVGPEGGFSPAEARAATEGGFIPVSLGSRILRTETAGLAIVTILQFFWGDLG
jgi:16S rRNA (uracil1498-N3)-methyltransferase